MKLFIRESMPWWSVFILIKKIVHQHQWTPKGLTLEPNKKKFNKVKMTNIEKIYIVWGLSQLPLANGIWISIIKLVHPFPKVIFTFSFFAQQENSNWSHLFTPFFLCIYLQYKMCLQMSVIFSYKTHLNISNIKHLQSF